MRKAQRQIGLDRHIPVKVREHDVIALIEMFSPQDGNDAPRASASRLSPSDAIESVVQHVLLASGEPEIRESVVVPDSVAVIDLCQRVVAVVQKPRKTMRHVQRLENLDADIPVMIAGASDSTFCLGAASDLPRYISRIGVVVEDIANFIWNNCKIHTVLPHVVARGRSVRAGRIPDYTPLGVYC